MVEFNFFNEQRGNDYLEDSLLLSVGVEVLSFGGFQAVVFCISK